MRLIESLEPLPRLFRRRVQRAGTQIAYRSRVSGVWRATLWDELSDRIESLAAGLLELGVGEGSAVAIVSSSRPEWAEVDMANLSIGAITVGLYPNLLAEQIRHILAKSRVQVVVVEDAAKRRLVEEALGAAGADVRIVTMQTRPELARAPVMTLQDLVARGRRRRAQRPRELSVRLEERRADEIATHIYTAGTVGMPKGVMLTHRNFHYVVRATNILVPYAG